MWEVEQNFEGYQVSNQILNNLSETSNKTVLFQLKNTNNKKIYTLVDALLKDIQDLNDDYDNFDDWKKLTF